MKYLLLICGVSFLVACTNASSETTDNIQETLVPSVEEVTDVYPENLIENGEENPLTVAGVSRQAAFNGTIIVPPQKHASVTLTMGGIVKNTTLLPGEYVRKGTVLATLENYEFIDLQQTYLEAHARTEFLAAEYKRQQTLSEQDAAPQKRSQESKAEYLSMKSRMEAAAAQLKIVGVSPEELLKTGIQPFLEIKAPLSGYVTGMKINIGKHLDAGESICDIIDKGETMLLLTVYEKDLNGLEAGLPISFQVNGMGDKVFHGTLISVGQEVDIVSRSLEVYARVKESNPRFRPGMYVTAQVESK